MGFSLEIRKREKKGRRFFLSFFSLCLMLGFFAIFMSNPALAAPYSKDLNDFINLELKPLSNTDIVIDSLLQQNERNANFNESNLRVLDSNWKSELRKNSQALISQVMDNDLARFLRKTKDESQGVYTDIAVIDAKGLNVSQTIVSNDYWNNGRARWDKTFAAKSYAPYISEIYFSDETKKFQVDVSFMIIANEQPVGIIAAGIDVEQLEEWKKRKN